MIELIMILTFKSVEETSKPGTINPAYISLQIFYLCRNDPF